MTFSIKSPAFADGARIPAKHTADGGDVSPPLRWSGVPEGTRSFALVCVDPDAPGGVFKHWALFNIPADRTGLPEGLRPDNGMKQGVNDFGSSRYEGPDPPAGHGIHHYHFRLMALEVEHLDLPATATVADVREAAKAFVVGEAEVIGTYSH